MKRFPLLWYFMATSLVAIVVVTAVLAVLLVERAERRFIKRSEAQGAIEIAHTLQMYYYNIVARQLENNPDLAIEDTINPMMLGMFARRTTFGLNITRIGVLDMQGKVLYSTDPGVVGIPPGSTDLLQRAALGTSSAKLERGAEIIGLDGEKREQDAVQSYITIRKTAPDSGEEGPSLGFLTISQDVTDAFAAARSNALRDAVIVAVITGSVLFLFLFLIVFRADRVISAGYRQLRSQQQEMEAFSYSVSHDLRAPLRGIDGFSQALLEDYSDRLDEQAIGYLQRVRAGSQHMGQLIDDLLGLSQVNRSEMRREEVDLSALARTITEEFREQEPERQVEFVIEDQVVVNGDAQLLRLALDNLLGNAWKFTGKTGQATIEFGLTERDGKLACFVRDDGTGFDMAYADKLFGAFQRLHTSSEFEGTGIGLATVQRIINRHGGRVWAEGAVGQGATFYFTLN